MLVRSSCLGVSVVNIGLARYCRRPMRARLLVALLVLLIPGCLWRSYKAVMGVHLDVLSGMAEKTLYNAESGRRPTSNDVTELTYPLERARQFTVSYRSYADRESYQRFVAALDQYQTLVTAIDAARGDEARWAAERQQLTAQYQAWHAAAEAVRAALARE
jgi:hypothetical protein